MCIFIHMEGETHPSLECDYKAGWLDLSSSYTSLAIFGFHPSRNLPNTDSFSLKGDLCFIHMHPK